MTVEEILDRLPQKEKFKSGTPATEAEIEHVEKTLDVVLQDSYKTLLRRHGFVRWFGQAIYGVYTHPEGTKMLYDYDATRRTLECRNEKLPAFFKRLPKNGVVISKYAGGGWYFLYSAGTAAAQVALFDHDQAGKVSQTWPTFEAFLIEIAQF